MAHRLTKEELDEQFEQFLKESLSDDSFDSNKKSMVLENLGKPIIKRTKKKDTPPWWAADDDSDDGDLVMTSRSFLKSQSTSQPIEEVEEENHIEEMHQSTQDQLITSMEKDSLEIDESVMAYGPNQSTNGVGLDTLEEQEEKDRFFAKLENGASSTIDYSRLNKELDSTDSTKLTALICNNETPKTEDEGIKELPGNYSEDFEDDPEALSPLVENSQEEHDGLENKKKEEEKHEMLAKVLLLDSVDSTFDTQKLLQQAQEDPESVTPKGNSEAMGTGISNQYTNSEMEALHQAYQNLTQLAEDTDEQKNYLKVTDHTSTSFVDTADSTGKSLKKIFTGESDMSTVDELMQPFKGEWGFDAKSLSENKEHGSVEKYPKGVLKEKTSIDYLEWFSGKTENFPVAKSELQHDSNTNVIQDNHSQYKFVASKEPSRSQLFAMHQGERSGNVVKYGKYSITSKAASDQLESKHSSKIVKNPSPVLKKGHNVSYAYVKSSGYGKTNNPIKSFTASDSLQSKSSLWQKKETSPSVKKHQKGILSATRTIRFAEDSFPEDTRTSGTQLQNQSAQGHVDFQRISGPIRSHENTAEDRSDIHYSNSIERDLTVLQRLQNVEEKLNAEHGHNATPQEGFSQKEDEFKLEIQCIKTKYEEDIKQLKQENYMLEAKLHAEAEKMKRRSHLLGDKNDPATEEKLQIIKQEIEEQETLLKGYQQENERLYQQVKELQFKNKENEEHMFKENQALKADIISLREKINSATRSNQYGSPGNESSNQSFTELIAELRSLQKKEANLLDDIARCKQEKQALEVDLVQLKKERDLLKIQVSSTSDEKSYEIKIIEESYKQEISRLNKRLQWFAENQEILDKDAARLRDAYEQIEKLKIQVEKLTQNAGNQPVQQRLKDRSADAKRIQDLERQVKEMEAIIKRRHPNSIPAIMYAAAAVSETDPSTKSSTVSFLERRIQKLECDLESKDEEAKKSLRSMEQQFQKVKIQYESRISELEELLAQKPLNDPQNNLDSTIKVKALEQELSILRDAHHITVLNLKKEMDTLIEKNSSLEHKTNAKFDEMTAQNRLTRLNQELIAKHKEIQELSKTVERLQKERMLMLSSKPHLSSVRARSKYLEAFKADAVLPSKGNTLDTETFPSMQDEKLYQPDTFADFHICDLQQENEGLQAEICKLSQEINQQKIKYEATLAQGEDAMKRLNEENAEQIAALKNLHQIDMEKLICQHAVEHSSSRVAELSSKVSTQEIMIKHLQKQVSELLKDRESLAVLRIREGTLQNEVKKLLDELKTASECHTPEMRHYLTLESKIKYMEMRHSQREQELQQVIQQTRHAAENVQTGETDKWKKLVHQKNMELEKFRSELDAILDVLRVLQRQGVVIPTTASEGS